ncbi:ABC transporter ATP-binding protein [Nannocystis bainbridge]|uniref:Sn-glycerol-3-phosphate ABC transporter ATP-binding protein UgpC n=1 Tax=Nannocystis bainbridge TaxID=2995303 RepID=A0ABT5DNS3_9BACT|nr:sn-glycerol-3-phosphate ABC transporter ATP-binding protein UgpC [Nannocystis bainbridge]MDC0715301.1 sn-glycerol-3-phosphate ABC transporter ATP-binding protein UgpC [Nannocystis bainbridge]
MVAVTARAIVKRFGATEVLRGVDVHVPDGGFAVLVGPSGCGKSTLLRLLAGLEDVTAGEIRFGERDVTRLAPRDRDIAMVFQSYALYPHLTVRDNLAFGLNLRKTDLATIASRVAEVSAMLGLDLLLDRLPRALSGGQRQRVAMGRAIVRRPQLFLFDEPLSNLDAALRAQVRVEIRKLHDQLGATSVYVTHDQVEAMTLADRIFVLNRGVVEQVGPPRDVYDHPRTRFVAGFLGSPAMNFLDGVQVDAGGLALPGGQRLAIRDPERFGDRLQPGRTVSLGVRPHDFVVRPDAPDLTVEVELVELLGPELQIHARLGGRPLAVCLDSQSGVARGDRLPLAVRALHLFDPETGQSLRV